MTTTVVKTIGTGGDYTTIQAWEDAAPANLVTVDQIWRGECKNQVFTESVSISGSTSDSTRYKELTTEAGASFSDNASVQTNALRYNTANGACVTRGTAWAAAVVSNSEGYARVSKLQIAATHSTVVAYSSAASTSSVDQCVIEYTNTVGDIAVYLYGGAKIKNSLVVCRAASASNAIVSLRNGSAAYNCTFVSTVSTANNGVYGSYSASTVQNCAVFGATTFGAGTAATCTTSYSNAGSLPSGVTSVAYDTSTGSGFENITDATRDFRIKTGSALLDVGTTDSTNAANDIAGTARPQGSAYDVGAWEYVSAGGSQTLSPSLLSNSNSFYAPTITPGAVTLSPGLFTNTNSFYAATITPGAVTLSPGLFTNSNSFFAPTITTGSVTLSPSLLTNSNSFYAPTITTGDVTLAPGLFTNSNTFYAATITPGEVTLTPTLFTNTNTFYSPVVTLDTDQVLTPARLSNTNTFFAPIVTPGGVVLEPGIVISGNVFYAPTVSLGVITLVPDRLDNSNAFFAPTVTPGVVTLLPPYFENANQFYAAVVSAGGTAIFPLPAQVLLGVTYGPTGADFTGTATGAGLTANDIAAAVWAYTQ